jgi:protocatechuate 3,4-dioxygenase, alpha subunit
MTEPTPAVAGLTPSQTVGPFLHIGLPWADGPLAAPQDAPGAITISGRMVDGAGEPVPDALVETWQVPADGARGFGRCPTDPDGGYRITTVRPKAQPDRDGGVEAPHIDVSIFSRGLLDRLVTRIYFPDAPENDADPVLASVDPDRRGTLIATEVEGGYRFDIRLQGGAETVFFDV